MSDVSKVVHELCVEYGDQVSTQSIVFAVTGARRALLDAEEGDDLDALRARSRKQVIDLVHQLEERTVF